MLSKKERIGFVAVLVIFLAVYWGSWCYLYGSFLDPRPDITVALNQTGSELAREYGLPYIQINDLASDPGTAGKYNWTVFMAKVNDTLPDSGKAVYTTFAEGYIGRHYGITAHYWIVDKTKGKISIVAAAYPKSSDRYPSPVFAMGPDNGLWYYYSCQAVTSNSLVFVRPAEVDLRNSFIAWGLCVMFFTFVVSVLAVAIVLLIGVCIWWQYFKKNEAPDETQEP